MCVREDGVGVFNNLQHSQTTVVFNAYSGDWAQLQGLIHEDACLLCMCLCVRTIKPALEI